MKIAASRMKKRKLRMRSFPLSSFISYVLNIVLRIVEYVCRPLLCVTQVALGWAGDQPWINVTKTYAVCMIICGFSVAAYPLVITSYWGIAFTSAIFGLSLASSYSYTPAILMELMPIDRFTVAYGLILLSQGLGHLIGPPIGGNYSFPIQF